MSAKIMAIGGGRFLGGRLVRNLAGRGDQVVIYNLVLSSLERG